MPAEKLLPRPVRLQRYLQVISGQEGVKAAAYLAAAGGLSAAVFRRDIRWVGAQVGKRLGRQGTGYCLTDLRAALNTVLQPEQGEE